MKITTTLFALFISFPLFACGLPDDEAERRLHSFFRTSLQLPDNTEVRPSHGIDELDVPKNLTIILKEKMMDEKVYEEASLKSPKRCPSRQIQIYRVYGHDPFRSCNGILKADRIASTHEVLYLNCGRNL